MTGKGPDVSREQSEAIVQRALGPDTGLARLARLAA